MRRLLSWALRLAGGALLVLAAATGGGYLWLRGSLPETAGEIALPGLAGTVTVARDSHGIPLIRADSERDAYLAMGFVHAQDRLWQMEVQRRTGEGRLSEVFGLRTLEADKFLRTLGIARAAQASWERFDAATRAAYEAYAAGVNAYLATRSGPLPLPFLLLGVRPEPWRPLDSLVWVKMMAWDLGGNWKDEWLRARLADRLPPEKVAELFPPYPADGPLVLPAEVAKLTRAYPTLAPEALLGRQGEGLGSNAWVLSGARSESGGPLLANDPHLSLNAPSQWYLAALAWPGGGVAGATLPGLPLPVLGRNARIAWGFTNTGPDVQDLFVERLDPAEPSRYLAPGGSLPFAERMETIAVKGAEPVTITVRETRHGPVISDLLEPPPEEGTVLAFAWTALAPDDLTAQAGLKLAHAGDWPEFVAALADFHAPQQNVVYADRDGNIGVYAPGRVPIRGAGDGFWPSPGWDGSHDWQGYVPFEELPHAFNPPDGVIVTANNRLVPDGYPYFITRDWAPPYRAERIETLLAEREVHTPASIGATQADTRSGMAAELLPLMLGLAAPSSAEERQALGLLERWDYAAAAARPEPLIFAAWERELVRVLFADELGDDFAEFWQPRPLLVARVLRAREAWCDDVTTAAAESCGEAVMRALRDALAWLAERYGERIADWRWGAAHEAVLRNRVLGAIPLLGPWLTPRFPSDGDAYTVNVAGYELGDEAAPFAQTTAPDLRAIYDLSATDSFWAIQNLGQSENPLSPYYRDLLPSWRLGRYVAIPLSEPMEPAETLTLVPATAARGEER